jgi:predicted transcriptional regulator
MSNNVRARGASHHLAKFTDEQVADIRSRYAAGGITQGALGQEFGVHTNTINRIIKGKAYPTNTTVVEAVTAAVAEVNEDVVLVGGTDVKEVADTTEEVGYSTVQ